MKLKDKINKKIRELKKVLKENTGKSFEKYNRQMVGRRYYKVNWDDVTCRQIVLLNSLKR